jgi:hypothetical protein
MRIRFSLTIVLLVLALPLTSLAHVNSPDVYYDGYAGPYHLLVTVRPPSVVPGVAQIQIRSATGDVDEVQVLPLRMVGEAAKLAPAADVAERSPIDPQAYSGKLWIMERGSWKVQVKVDGKKGKGELAVPLPAVSTKSTTMQAGLGSLLAVLGLVLVAGLVGIIGAASREANLEAGQQPAPAQRKLSYLGMGVAALVLIGVLLFGNWWWGLEASANARHNYLLPQVQPVLGAGNVLQLQLENPNDMNVREPEVAKRLRQLGVVVPDAVRLDDLVPDHGHLLHLFLVRMPDMKSFWHLHPEQTGVGQFADKLPALPAGHYQIYADIVHQTGFPETQVGTIDLPGSTGEPLAGDDSGVADLAATDKVAQLTGSYRMIWERDQQPLVAGQPVWFRYRVEGPDGKPASLENYMGMAGHAAFISDDGKVFAHVHPAGSVSMAAVDLAGNQKDDMQGMNGAPMNGEVSFPYGFPQPGDYHIFVQVKRAGHVETGAFAAHVVK